MTEKILGYALLGVGIFLIIIAAVSVFMVFTKQAVPVQLFQLQGISLNLGPQLPSTEIIPAAMVNDSSNLFAHIVLMGFIAGVGQKLASLGVQLVRPIVVKLNEQKL